MALISYQNPALTGTAITFAAANGGGDEIQAKSNSLLLVRNDDASPVNVTIVVPGNDQYGGARPDIVKSVGAGEIVAFGPFPDDLEAADGKIDITYAGVTDLFVAAVLAQ